MPENTPTPVPASQGQATDTRSGPWSGRGYGDLPRLAPLSPRPVARFTHCPPPPPDLTEPSLANLVHGLTLPSALATPAIAQEAVEIILDTHRAAAELTDAALLLTHDLVAYACGLTGAGEQLHLSLCSAENALQFTVYDTHAAHRHPRLAAACDERRRCLLAPVAELVEARLGVWGFGPAHPPGAGTCTWAGIPHAPERPAA
ncbi:ATP-binding protein [Streptomyces anulatus]|uniref:ATP-binding protein n=1 Tax=Streptomyces anulatus TaxID=1892 RepID=UPI001ADF6580|nr:ATP-binding protein [Streptomyces anulatus]